LGHKLLHCHLQWTTQHHLQAHIPHVAKQTYFLTICKIFFHHFHYHLVLAFLSHFLLHSCLHS
jgi:hypothetical protein